MTTPPPGAPSWPHCGQGANAGSDPVGCRGRQINGYSVCLAHISDVDRSAYLSTLRPGSDADYRGTHLTGFVFNALLRALRTSNTSPAIFGFALFDEATFEDLAYLDSILFNQVATFNGATFTNHAVFRDVTFSSDVGFSHTIFSIGVTFTSTRFEKAAIFNEAKFLGNTSFLSTHFNGNTRFDDATFTNHAGFSSATFSGKTQFAGTTFTQGVNFAGTNFNTESLIGPISCTETLDLSGAIFNAPVTIEAAARRVECIRTQWNSTANLRLRHSDVDLTGAVLTFPVSVATHPSQFRTSSGVIVDESFAGTHESRVRVVSVQSVDAAHLVLADTDLSDCLFSGAFHLDQIHLDGRSVFATPPIGIHFTLRRWPIITPVLTRRNTVAEEHHWRAMAANQPAVQSGTQPSLHNWRSGPHHPDPDQTPDPEDVAALYRQLRKASEDAKDEPGAADFYYGEMEMRRHSRTWKEAERWLLQAYWLLSGYGLRASRALGWLSIAMVTTIFLMMTFGLPKESPKQEVTGILPANGGLAKFNISKDDPVNATEDRLTGKRFEKSLNVTLNSVVFRSSGDDLTTAGGYIEMASRFSEPILLGLAALAIRGRVKR
ncbi:pentapeptide repeat-containing protein [Streptomyces turgidiscabies]|nr:pentapeptide repeat-containing protein [Streptomyces turgidiscabies]